MPDTLGRKTGGFRETLLSAAYEERKSGRLGWFKYAKIQIASNNPETLEEIQSAVLEQAVRAGKIAPQAAEDPSAFDWSSLLAFIKELLPLILQIISIFSKF